MTIDTKITELPRDAAAPLELLLEADPSPEHVAAQLQAGRCFVAREVSTESVVAAGILVPRPDQHVELTNIAVREDLRSAGLGRQLLQHMILAARASGARCLQVGTGNSSLGPLAFYQRQGFRITGVLRDHFTRNYPEPIVENGIPCRDMILLELALDELAP